MLPETTSANSRSPGTSRQNSGSSPRAAFRSGIRAALLRLHTPGKRPENQIHHRIGPAIYAGEVGFKGNMMQVVRFGIQKDAASLQKTYHRRNRRGVEQIRELPPFHA